ncbi:MAG TPA: GNAT family N-acetyltransferase [Rhizomicrobium sp.]|nr:GNAT family N-acetyltransferase [Rhizomicrobium sp.]
MTVRGIEPADDLFAAMKNELAAAGLPTDDLLEGDARYFALESFGFGGYVPFGEHALLRSIVVPPGSRGSGHGTAILQALLAEARAARCREAWLLTSDAAEFFVRHGFDSVPREQAPTAVAGTSLFRDLCSPSAVLMCQRLAA